MNSFIFPLILFFRFKLWISIFTLKQYSGVKTDKVAKGKDMNNTWNDEDSAAVRRFTETGSEPFDSRSLLMVINTFVDVKQKSQENKSFSGVSLSVNQWRSWAASVTESLFFVQNFDWTKEGLGLNLVHKPDLKHQ